MSYISHKSEESAEDYLETIYVLSRRLPVVRSVDIANELNFSKPSVSVAMKNLKNKDCVTVTGEGYIQLTEKGMEIAVRTYERHTLLSDWLTELGVPVETASEDACRMEHDMSTETFEALKAHILRNKSEHPI